VPSNSKPGGSATPSFPLRPGTNDDVIYGGVIERNEYRLPDRFAPGATVIDIGTHAGMFSYLALTRGASEVHGFEADRTNYECAARNLAPFGERAHMSNRAVWRSDLPASALHFWPSSDRANTGGGSVIWETDGTMVEAIAFDDIVGSVGQNGSRRINLLKIDCEGAEFPILLTSKTLGQIDRIVGEYHELKAPPPAHARVPGFEEFSLEALVAVLEAAGFHVESERQATATYGDLGLFFAERPVPARDSGGLGAIREWLDAKTHRWRTAKR
jgi:FkbM family methyltransferase